MWPSDLPEWANYLIGAGCAVVSGMAVLAVAVYLPRWIRRKLA